MSPISPAPVRVDADLYDDFANPARLESYPRESRGFVRIDISLRSYWHTLFDTCPRLLELSGPDGRSIFFPFMAWARDMKLSFNWAFFLWVYEWLLTSQFRDRLDEELLRAMMTASAVRWMAIDRDIDRVMIVLGSRALTGAIVGSKINSIYCGLDQVERLEFAEPLPAPSSGHFGYFVLPHFALTHFPGWQPIPR